MEGQPSGGILPQCARSPAPHGGGTHFIFCTWKCRRLRNLSSSSAKNKFETSHVYMSSCLRKKEGGGQQRKRKGVRGLCWLQTLKEKIAYIMWQFKALCLPAERKIKGQVKYRKDWLYWPNYVISLICH